jgi:hypothetical protein
VFVPAKLFQPSLMFQVLHSRVGSRPHPQTLDEAGKACKGQTLKTITKNRIIRTKKFYKIGPVVNIIKHFFLRHRSSGQIS